MRPDGVYLGVARGYVNGSGWANRGRKFIWGDKLKPAGAEQERHEATRGNTNEDAFCCGCDRGTGWLCGAARACSRELHQGMQPDLSGLRQGAFAGGMQDRP